MSRQTSPIFLSATTVTGLCLSALVVACAGGGGGNKASAPAKGPEARFAASNFGNPATGANKWLPLKPGTQWVREGRVSIGHRRLSHRVVSTVTDVSKRVDGVRTVAVMDQDFNGGQIAEQSLDYLAEDRRGNVWELGTYTESYEGGQFVNAADGRLAGIKGATPTILMKARPGRGAGGAGENAEVAKTGQSRCVPFKCYKGVLVILEGGSEHKSYAPGVGQIKTEPLSKSGKEEVEDLVNLTNLSPRGLSEMSAVALRLDRHAAVTSKGVFGHAPLAKRTL
jgi:hypothetical protein